MSSAETSHQTVLYPWLKTYPREAPWEMEIPVSPVYDLLARTLETYGHRPAFDFMDKKWTWGQIGAQVNRMARGLQDMGVGKGTKVGLFLPNCPYFLIAYYAVLRAGGTVVNFNPLYANREIKHQIEDSHTDYMVTLDLHILHEKMEDMLATTRLKKLIVCRFTDILKFPKNVLFPIAKKKDAAKITDESRIIWFHDLCRNAGDPLPVSIDPRTDVAVLQYTGGTTGVPKGAMLTHANITANVHQSVSWFHNARKGEERMMGILPFFHVFAMTTVMNFSVHAGLEIIVPAPRFELDKTVKAIAKKKPHYLPAVPAIYNAINNHPKRGAFDLTSLRLCISGGAPLPVEVKKMFEKNTGCTVIEGYGLTESSPVVCANPVTGENKPGSIGLPLPGTIVEIIDPADKKTPMRPGGRGELCVRGPQVMKGYWNKTQETADILVDGRLYTGDIAIMDESGYVFIVDRIKDMIIMNGYNVYPRNIEEAIYLHPSVEECIVAGIPDEARGEVAKAWVKAKAGTTLSAEDIRSFLKDKLSPMEMPRYFEMRDKPLPKTMIGKLSRKDILAEEAAKKG